MRFVNIRVETIGGKEDFLKRIKHNTRFKKSPHVTNDRGFFIKNMKNIRGFRNEYATEMVNRANVLYDEIAAENAEKNREFRAKRTRSVGEGILYFSKGINEDFEKNQKDFHDRLLKMFQDFETKNRTDVLNFQIHADETGNVHVHFMFKNFDRDTGRSLKFTKNREQGAYLQDLAYKHFGSFGKGYERGIRKSKTDRHLGIEDFKAMKDAQKELENVQNQLAEGKRKLEALSNEIQASEGKMREIEMRKARMIQEFENVLEDLEDLAEAQTVEKFVRLALRYMKNESEHRFQSLIEKHRKMIAGEKPQKSKKQKYQDIGR